MSSKALLIIDMQRGDFPPHKHRHEAKTITEKIQQIATDFRKKGHQVIYIQHDGSAENVFIPGTEDWRILPELTPQQKDLVVSKTANNAFYKSELHAQLQSLQIDELCVTGSATDFCVNATVQAGLALDYNITVIADAHTTGDRPNLGAQQVIDYYNWLWPHMTPTQGMIKVKNYRDIE